MVDYQHYQSIAYKDCGSIAVLLNLDTPTGEAPAGGWPLVIFFHGGGWVVGDKNSWGIGRGVRNRLLPRGVAFCSAGYRHAEHGAHWPVPAADCADCVRFFVRNAEKYHIDPSRIVLAGHSAGAHLALLTGLTEGKFTDRWSIDDVPCKPIGTVTLATPANFHMGDYGVDVLPSVRDCPRNLLGDELWADPAKWEVAEPLHYVKTGEAAHIRTLLVNGELDDLTPIGISREFVELAQKNGYDSRLFAVPECGHCLEIMNAGGAPSPNRWMADDAVCAFLEEVFGL